MRPHKKALKKTKTWRLGLAAICLLSLLVGGCSGKGQVKIVHKAVLISPPVTYLDPVEHPTLQGGKNKDLLVLVQDYEDALTKANFQIGEIKEWANKQKAR